MAVQDPLFPTGTFAIKPDIELASDSPDTVTRPELPNGLSYMFDMTALRHPARITESFVR
jgi:hypothetical protein